MYYSRTLVNEIIDDYNKYAAANHKKTMKELTSDSPSFLCKVQNFMDGTYGKFMSANIENIIVFEYQTMLNPILDY